MQPVISVTGIQCSLLVTSCEAADSEVCIKECIATTMFLSLNCPMWVCKHYLQCNPEFLWKLRPQRHPKGKRELHPLSYWKVWNHQCGRETQTSELTKVFRKLGLVCFWSKCTVYLSTMSICPKKLYHCK